MNNNDIDEIAALAAQASGEIERVGSRPIALTLSLSQLMLVGALIATAVSAEDTPLEMRGEGVELVHGIVGELMALDLGGTANMILAALPDEEVER